MEEETPPLEQRQSGRKSRRAARAKTNNNKEEEATIETPPTKEDSTTTASRGPSDEIERRIAERIERRTATNVVAAVNEEMYGEEETEILGTYEYLDHTADIQIHSMGSTLEEALEQLALAMFGYMTKVSLVEIDTDDSSAFGLNVRVEAHYLASLVFSFLQEWLSVFHETHFVPRKVTVESIDLDKYTVVSSGQGETMKTDKHVQGTEVKAVTYSNLQVIQNEQDGSWDIWVIVDI